MKTTMPSAVSLMRETVAALRKNGFAEPEKEAELLVCHAFGVSRTELYRDELPADEAALRTLDSLLRRRLCREPIEYVTGFAEFRGLRFGVGRGVLIPRPETELLVEETLRLLRTRGIDSPEILDLCTGSGCIAVAIAREMPGARIVASDVSASALSYAVKNADMNGTGNVFFVQGDLFAPVGGRSFDIIVSNPPYVKGDELAGLQVEVREYEPVEALDGGRDGLDFYRRILNGSQRHLRDGGFLVLELGFGQRSAVAGIAVEYGLRVERVLRDVSGIERVMILERLDGSVDERGPEAV
ncbi:MAG: peptide chain release factor N(5)-glutamine methyltransferase [Nitrospirae bacterium]|nr:peptide chain release factor N(5)-glutamine methyltransferase [Nitrospirota bacterium]